LIISKILIKRIYHQQTCFDVAGWGSQTALGLSHPGGLIIIIDEKPANQ
ncbi:hypothetical protein LCGC14_3072290, partial [marine sediment metagenome]